MSFNSDNKMHSNINKKDDIEKSIFSKVSSIKNRILKKSASEKVTKKEK